MKTRSKGFTLIELLAVIVILAIIALIATPTILNVIEKARKGAAESSALGYIDAVEKQIMINELDTTASKLTDNVYKVSDLTIAGVTVKGDKPEKDKDNNDSLVKIERGQVVDYSLKIGDYVVNYDATNKKASATKGGTLKSASDLGGTLAPSTPTYVAYTTGNEILYDPKTGTTCTSVGENCMRFYAIEDSDSSKSTVDAILDHNTTAMVVWNSDNVNTTMKEVATALANDTQGWQGNPRLITANEVARITGNSSFDASQNGMRWFCLDTNAPDNTNYCAKAQGTSAYKWLFNNTTGCTSYGCDANSVEETYGYWTSTAYAGSGSYVWRVVRGGSLNDRSAARADAGVRPVITVSKSVAS